MVLDFLRRGAQTLLGAPRLYTAARSAGASHPDAVDVLAISAAALQTAAADADGTPGRQNAVRHFIWQACLAARHGPAIAEAVAAAQEEGRTGTKDSEVDLRNNGVGRAYGVERAAEIRQGSTRDALARLVAVAAAKWDADELVWIRPH